MGSENICFESVIHINFKGNLKKKRRKPNELKHLSN